MAILSICACKKTDNYPAPSETLTGTITDLSTGEPIQTDNGIRIRLDEISYSSNPIPQYLNVKQDGTFKNSRLFPGTYRIYPQDGAFVPVVYTTASGTVVDGSKTVEIRGTADVLFSVSPFLKVEWVGEPVLNNDNTVTVSCRFTRGTDDPAFIFNVTDAYLFISTTPFVSNASFDNKLSAQVTYSGTAGNALLGQTVNITSKAALGENRTYYVRVGARTNDNVNKRYNYTSEKAVEVPVK
jgi:hypothetical protein